MVQSQSGGYTQLVSVFSSLILLLILLFLARVLFYLPRAVLSAIIAVNLLSLFRKYPEAYRSLYLKKKYTELILFGLTNLGGGGLKKILVAT